MHKLTKIILVSMTMAVSFTPVSVLAASDVLFNGVCGNGGGSSAVCQDSGSPANPWLGSTGFLFKISAFIALIAGVAAVIVILISGLSFITSGGDSAKAQRARGSLIGALIGLVVIVLSETIIGFVLSKV
jgi:hypothetical protein